MGLFKTRLKCEGAKNNQCVLGCPVLQTGCIKVELGEKCKSRRGEEERYRNPDINVAAARRDQIGNWDLGELGGLWSRVWFRLVSLGVPWHTSSAGHWSAQFLETLEAKKILLVGWCRCWQGSGILGWRWWWCCKAKFGRGRSGLGSSGGRGVR